MTGDLTGRSLLGGNFVALGSQTFRAVNPAEEVEIDPPFVAATEQEVRTACLNAKNAFPLYRSLPAKRRAEFLNAIADTLGSHSQPAAERAHQETGLPMARLTGEIVRTQNQLRMFAELVTEGSWVDATIDHADPDRKPLPKPDLRRMLVPLGPVAVFGASNFPFAFSVAGGDTASALAAGCTVVVKAHPAHPGASEWAARSVLEAMERCNVPLGTFSMIHGGNSVGAALVGDNALEAVAFTGSFQGGMALARLVAARKRPIPIYAEMGSINPVVVLPAVIATNLDQFAAAYASSLTLGVGQFCTNPGLLLGYGDGFRQLTDLLQSRLDAVELGPMLTRGIRDNYEARIHYLDGELGIAGSQRSSKSGGAVQPRLFSISGQRFLESELFAEETFGPAAVAVQCDSFDELLRVVESLPGQLTASVHGADHEMSPVGELISRLTHIAGRVLFNGFPTGVEVCSSMNHGGPFPATLDGRHTSVGTAAIHRFVRAISFQDLPDSLLPAELQDSNPNAISRRIDGRLVAG